MTVEERGFLKPLTGVRAIAAFLIFFSHYNIFEAKFPGSFLALMVGEFHIGVSLFFVLSGFLITYRYYHRHREILTKRFYIKRFARIYPLYFLLLTATYLYAHINGEGNNAFSLHNYLFNITLLSGFFNELKFTGIAQAWSLTAAEVFYLFTPLIFFFMKKKLINLVGCIISFMLFGCLLVVISHGFHNPNGFFGSFEFMFTYTFFGRCFEFIAGILVAIYYLRNKENLANQKTQYLTYIGLVGTFFCIFLLSCFPENDNHFMIRFLLYSFLLPIVGFTPLYLGLISSKTFISRILSSQLLQLLGKASYAFYLIHLGFLAKIIQSVAANQLLFFLMLNIVAIGLYFSIEKPMNKLIKNIITL